MNWFWDNLRLKKEERIGMSIFICILFCLLMIKWYLVVLYVPKGEYNNYDFIANMEYSLIDSYVKESTPKSESSYSSKENKSSKQNNKQSKFTRKEANEERVLFVFDPNVLGKDSLLLLGINEYAANNIEKYRQKGGRYKSARDLQKVYGLDSIIYNEIYSFVKIKKPKTNRPTENDKTKSNFKEKPITYSKSKLELKSIDINLSDTTDFKKLKGIGSVYSNRIVKFRNSLGGFFSIDQIKDVWGVSDSLFQTIKPYLAADTSALERKNINALDKEELVKHPYIDWKKAKVILKYKKMHGDYTSMDDFRKMHGISDAFVDTLTYYFVAE